MQLNHHKKPESPRNRSGHSEVREQAGSISQAVPVESKYPSLLDNLLEGVQVIGFDWRYVYVNQTVVKQSKFSQEELVGCTMMEKYPGIEKTELFKALKLCMEMRVASTFENEFNYPDGSTGWFNLSIQPADDGLVILSNDISERKKAEKENQSYLKGLERILFMTSHNLRQPITQLQGLIGLLKSGELSTEERGQIIGLMEAPATALDIHTREITGFVHIVETNARNNDTNR